MAFDPHSNFGYSTVATAPSPAISGTSLTLSDASDFPDPGAQGYNITIWPDGQQALSSNAEIARVTVKVGAVLTITRAQEGTSARAIVITDQVAVTVTAKTVTDIEAAIPSTAGLLSAINVSAGATSNNLSALTFSNSNGVSFGLTGSTLTASVATNYQSQGAYLTTAALSQDSSKYAGINGAITGGSITVNTSGVSVNLPAYLTTAALSQDSSKYAGTNGAITGGSITVNTSGVSVNLPAYLTTAMQSNAVTLSNIRVSAGTTSNLLSALTFSNANGLAFGLDAGTITGSYTVPTQTVQTQNMIAASLSGNTAGVLALVSSGTAYFAGGNNITLSQNGQSITISGANAGGAQTAISGIVVSDATYTSGTVSFSGNNITIASSVNGATQYIKLSGNAAQTNQSAIKAFGVSNTGQTAGNTGLSTGIDWVLAGSQSITLSQSTAGGGPNTVWFQHPAWLTTAALSADSSKYAGTNGAITGGSITVNTSGVSVNLPAYISSQSTQFLAMTIAGNTAGTSTFHATNNASLFFNGGNNITLSGNGSTVTIIGANTSAQQTGISGIIVSDATYSSGTVSFSNAGNITISSSVNGATQYIKLSGNAAQTNQSAIKGFGASNTGNTAGNTGISTGIDWVIAGTNNITISQSTAGGGPNTIWVSGPTGAQTGISGIVVSDTTYTSGTVSFSGNNITIASSVNGATQYIKLSGNAAQTNQSAIKAFGVSNTGNTAGNTGVSTGIDWVMAGSGSLTLSQSTAGGGPNTIWWQHPAWLTTAALSQDSSKYAGTNGAITGGSITVNTSGVSVNLPAYLTTADLSANSSKYVQEWALTGNTAGTTSSAQGTRLYFSGGNSITISGSSNSLVFSVGNYLTTADLSANSSKYVQEWALTGNTAGTTSSAQGTRLYFSGGNSITISGSSNSLVFSVGNYLTTAALSQDSSKYAGINGAITGGSITVNTSGVSVNLPAYLTTAALSGDTSKYAQAWELAGNTAGTTSSAQGTKWYLSGGANLTISGNSNTLVFSAGTAAPSPVNFSAGTTSSNLGSVVFSNSNGVSFGLNGSTITATVSTYDTVGTATSGYPVASANSIGTVTRWAAEDHRHAGIGGIGISTGNTTGTSGSNVGTYWFAGGGGVSLSQITSNNGSHTIVVTGPVDGYNGYLEPYPLNTATATLLPTAGSWYLAPFTAFGSVSGGRVNFLAVNTGTANLFQDLGETAYKSNTTGTLNQSYSFSAAMAIFSQGTGTNSTRLESVWSNSHSWGWSKVINVSTNAASNIAVSLAHSLSYQSEIGSNGAYTNVQYANAGSSTIANSSGNSTLVSTVFSSGRNIISGSLVQPFGFSTTLTAGVYWMGYAWSTTRASASTGGQLVSGPDFGFSGLLGMSRLAVDSLYRNFGSTVTTARSQLIPYGVYTGGANMAPPTAIALSSDLSSLASQWVPYFNFNYRGLTK